MSYTLQGIVGDEEILAGAETAIAAEVITLPQGKALLLFTERFRKEHLVPFLPLTDEGGDLPDAIRNLCARISLAGRIAYVEAEFFGASGTQASVVWHGGDMIQPPLIEQDAINTALRCLGVQTTQGTDEFDALRLGAHRDIEEWIEDPE